jgi:hypothetical protein
LCLPFCFKIKDKIETVKKSAKYSVFDLALRRERKRTLSKKKKEKEKLVQNMTILKKKIAFL